MKELFKVLGVLALTLVALAALAFVVLAYFSQTKSAFRCEGELTRQSQTKPVTFFMTLEKYRWWVGLWSRSKGMIVIEAPKEQIAYEPYLHLQNVGDSILNIWKHSNSSGVFEKDPLTHAREHEGFYVVSASIKARAITLMRPRDWGIHLLPACGGKPQG